jgi:hypothetical protein
MPDSTLTKLRCALWGVTRQETACVMCLLDCGISVHLATKILRLRFTQRSSTQIFRGTSFLERFPPET